MLDRLRVDVDIPARPATQAVAADSAAEATLGTAQEQDLWQGGQGSADIRLDINLPVVFQVCRGLPAIWCYLFQLAGCV